MLSTRKAVGRNEFLYLSVLIFGYGIKDGFLEDVLISLFNGWSGLFLMLLIFFRISWNRRSLKWLSGMFVIFSTLDITLLILICSLKFKF